MPREQHQVAVGAEADFPPGRFVMVDVAGRDVGVIRLLSGEWRAVRNRCPHKAAPICRGIVGGTWPPGTSEALRYERAGEVLVCPWHGWEYDLKTGNELFRENPTRLLTYPVTIHDGQVQVTIGKTRDL